MTFNNLGLIEPIIHAVQKKGYSAPTPIQAATIPCVLENVDVMASAQTGTGKTAAFVLPLLQQLAGKEKTKTGHIRVLILTPTRELAAQIHASVRAYGTHLKVSSAVIFGGVNVNPQIRKLKQGVDILVATPGRLLDLFRQKAVRFDCVRTFVLDEADRMLDMGFIPDITRIQRQLPEKKQTLLFSATFSNEIRKLAKTMLREPIEIDVAPRNATVATIDQRIHPVDKKAKTGLLRHLILENQWTQVLVFCRTKHGANRLVKDLLKAKIRSVAMHGNKSQTHRTRALADFKHRKFDVLVATDIAARGIDIIALPHVVNFDLPNVAEDYIHRIGRTGRAGGDGEAISLVSADEIKQLVDIERLLKRKLERFEVEGFEPEHQLPETSRESGRANRRARESNVASLEKKRRSRRYGRSGHEGKNRGDSRPGNSRAKKRVSRV